MRLHVLSIRDNDVQRFLWNHLNPTDFRDDYTILDAIKEVERQIYAGQCFLLGDLDEWFMFRIQTYNEKAILPHVMGNGSKMRSAITQAVPMMWQMGFEQIVISTQYAAIARITAKMGFTMRGSVDDLFVLTMEREHGQSNSGSSADFRWWGTTSTAAPTATAAAGATPGDRENPRGQGAGQ